MAEVCNEMQTWAELFQLAASYGLSPNEVLDLNLGQLAIFIEGVEEERFRVRCQAIESAYFNGYYYREKKPAPPATKIRELERLRDAALAQARGEKVQQSKDSKPKEVISIDQFLELERKRLNGGEVWQTKSIE